MHFLLETDGFLSSHFESWHAVYSDYIPGTTKESPVLPWFFPSAKISEIHNRFSVFQRLLLLGWNGSSATGSLFHSGCFHRTPGVLSESFSKDTASCFFRFRSFFFIRIAPAVFTFIYRYFRLIAAFVFWFPFRNRPQLFPAWQVYVSVALSYPMFSRLLISFLKLLFFHFLSVYGLIYGFCLALLRYSYTSSLLYPESAVTPG